MPIYNKAPLDVPGQLAHLLSKGMTVNDPVQAERYLRQVGLYRFKGYAHIFKDNATHRYVSASFEAVQELMLLDEALRLHVLSGLQRLEIALRVAISEQMTLRYHSHWYADPSVMPKTRQIGGRTLSMRTDAAALAGRAYAEFLRHQDDSPRHYRTRYDAWVLPPSWIMTEVLSFGTWSMVFASLDPQDRQVIAQQFGLPSDTLENWLQALTILRNKAAHHSRLWNATFRPLNLPGAPGSALRRALLASVFVARRPETTLAPRLYAMHALLTTLGERRWSRDLRLVNRVSSALLGHVGFRPGWEAHPTWN